MTSFPYKLNIHSKP